MNIYSKKNSNAIGILDYGIGGIGLYKILKSRGFQCPIYYFSDSGYTPYGKVPEKQLTQRVERLLHFFSKMGVSHVILACNAASTIISKLKVEGMEIVGIINFGIQAVIECGCSSALLLGGGRTVRSGAYRNGLRTSGIILRQRNAQPLSIMIESGAIESFAIQNLVKKYVYNMKPGEALILACTHYPAILHLFQQYSPAKTIIVDPSEKASDFILSGWNFIYPQMEDLFFTTGNPEIMKSSSLISFNINIPRVSQINIDNPNFNLINS